MKIDYIQISNVLSFPYAADPTTCQKIIFDKGINILIGQNGAGKSTLLEVINFILKKAIFSPYTINHSNFLRRDLDASQRPQTIPGVPNQQFYAGFRLEPNWLSEAKPQQIIVKVAFDEIDITNLKLIKKHRVALNTLAATYSYQGQIPEIVFKKNYTITLNLQPQDKSFVMAGDVEDGGYQYLLKYQYYRRLIEIHNRLNPTKQIGDLLEPMTLISGYQNYSAFSPGVSLAQDALEQMQHIKVGEYLKSANSSDTNEPAIFNLVRLAIAQKHYHSVFTKMDNEEATKVANDEPFLLLINAKLALIDLKVQIELVSRNNWSYNFNFLDLKHNKILTDINSLSAGQKAIVHLIFEAYGRGELKGGVIIIDEPEIHLHYQLQHEYFKIIETLNQEQDCQYILVTHSEALINSETITKVKRFSLDVANSTVVTSPNISSDQKTLVKILDNTKSTYAFFAKKIILVEGDTDRYFFRSVLEQLYPNLTQEIAVIDIGGKGNYANWKKFFEGFALKVYLIADFDNLFTMKHGSVIPLFTTTEKAAVEQRLKQTKLDNLTVADKQSLTTLLTSINADPDATEKPKIGLWKPLLDKFRNLSYIEQKVVIADFKSNFSNILKTINGLYADRIYILKLGAVEDYTNTAHGDLNSLITFCLTISTWLNGNTNSAKEIAHIFDKIVTD